MKRKRFYKVAIWIGVGLCMFGYGSVHVADVRDVVINEVAWMGTNASSDDEWIELYNNTDVDIDLSGWTLVAEDGTPGIALSGTIPAKGYFLLERTDDNTVSDMTADQIYSGALGNSGEKILLKDGQGQLVDEVDCSGGWFAGTNSPKATMERKHTTIDGSASESWDTNNGVTMNGNDADGNPISGTPKTQNSDYDIHLSVEESPEIPRTCLLLNNYPNPFNPSTTIWYRVTEKEAFRMIALRVYDLLGQEVLTMVNRIHIPGEYAVVWDGKDDTGKEVSSGVYVCRMVSDGKVVRSKKMLKIE
ncbi:MAG: lamin tail domain-containing protein [bacterium]